MYLWLDWCTRMSSIPIFVLICLVSIMSVVQSRPREKTHQGLYDDLKPVPFVDNPNEYGYMYGVYSNKLGKKDKASNDNLEQYYEKYNREHDRYIKGDGTIVGDNNDIDKNNADDDEKDKSKIDLVELPVEGGADTIEDKQTIASKEDAEKVESPNEDMVTLPNDQRSEKVMASKRKSQKSGKKHQRHRKHDKKRKAGKKSARKSVKNSKKDISTTTTKPGESDENFLGSIDQVPSNFNMNEFYKEHPNFKENVATITDNADINVTPTQLDIASTIPPDSSEDDDGDDDDHDDFDVEDDGDDAEEEGKDSESNDKSSELYEYYDYYDEKGDSSYSSSEVAAENANFGTPYDWFKQYERMFGDQPAGKEPESKEDEIKTVALKEKEIQTTEAKPVTKTAELTSKSPQTKIKMADSVPEIMPKTDIEPSTSPNPPTPQKDIRSTVTQPAIPQWKQKLNSWNYIESRPVESCKLDGDCSAGRMCKFGLCLCGQPDFCDGHNKPVCGSDGQMYPSHCELHRSACILGFHIRIDHDNTCFPKEDKDVTDAQQGKKSIKVNDEKSQPNKAAETPNAADLVQKEDNEHDSKAVDDHVKDIENNKSPEKDDGDVRDDDSDGEEADDKYINDVLDQSEVSKDVVIGGEIKKAVTNDIVQNKDNEAESSENGDNNTENQSNADINNGYIVTTSNTLEDETKESPAERVEADKVSLGAGSIEEADSESASQDEEDSLVPLFCTPDVYLKFKADVLGYHCNYFGQLHCDRQTQEEKQKLAILMFNYFDDNYDGKIEKEELWEMQLRERIDEISSLCTLLDIVTFDELGEKDSKLSADEFIQAFDIPDLLEHQLEIVPLLTTVGNGLEVKCDVTASTDVVWKRNDVDLSLLDFPGISVLSDGSLYIETINVDHVSNLTCYDRKKPTVKQLHMLTIQKPPHVTVWPENVDTLQGKNVVLHCHAEGYPRSTIEWQFNDNTVQHGAKYSIRDSDSSLTVMNVSQHKDTGVYKCIARNNAGVAESSIQMTVHSFSETKYFNRIPATEESFIVFHDNGYSMYEPSLCLSQRHLSPEFGNFFYIPDELDAPPALCEDGVPCVWGTAINVRDTFVYATQPRENRIVVIDVKVSFNPNQVIFTDHIPVSLHYIHHLDEVWVLCWNGEIDNGSKTIVIIRNASQKIQHHAIHTQPIGNRFDQVQDLYLPPDCELHHPYEFGYTVHNGQQGLFKIDLQSKEYLKAVDLTKYACVPKSVAFVPLGGHVLVQCIQKSASGETSMILDLDYITDIVTQNFTLAGIPFVTPDSNNVVVVDKENGKVSVFKVNEQGAIERQFEVSIESEVDRVTFHKARYSPGYDIYLVSIEAPIIYSVSLTNGKVDTIKNVGESDPALFLPWAKMSRPLVSGDVFSSYLATTSESSMTILDGQHHKIHCDFTDIRNPTVLTYSYIHK